MLNHTPSLLNALCKDRIRRWGALLPHSQEKAEGEVESHPLFPSLARQPPVGCWQEQRPQSITESGTGAVKPVTAPSAWLRITFSRRDPLHLPDIPRIWWTCARPVREPRLWPAPTLPWRHWGSCAEPHEVRRFTRVPDR